MTEQQTQVERNKALVRRYFEETMNKENQDAFAELVTPDFVHRVVGLPDSMPGPEGDRQFHAIIKTAFPGSRVTIEDMIAEGDKVVLRITCQNNHQGDFMGIPATGKDCPIGTLTIARIKDDKIAEIYTIADLLGLLQQIGAVPALGQANETLMLSDLQKRKLTNMFHALDANHSGYLEYADFDALLTNLAQLSEMAAGSPEYEQLQSGFRTRWDHIRQFAETNRDEHVRLDEWLAYCSELVQSPDKVEQEWVSTARLNARLMDRDGDGLVSLEEFAAFRANLDTDNRAIFERFDLNGDGYIPGDEFPELFRQFFLSDDPDAPGNWFFGPF
jgi:steroid delta-isomerase-like uncharacterized protein